MELIESLFELFVPNDLLKYAKYYEDNSATGNAIDYTWEYIATFPLSNLINSSGSVYPPQNEKEWVIWFDKENDDMEHDMGNRLWDYLANDDIEEPIVISYDENNRWDLWDGWHRVGASIKSNKKIIPAIIGQIKT